MVRRIVRPIVFLRSFVDFDGLTSDEIVARLFFWYFTPSFAEVLFAAFGPAEWLRGGAYLGIALTAFIVWRDAEKARIERTWAWALFAGLVPLIGWWAYGRRRAPSRPQDSGAYRGRPPAIVRYLHPFWRTRLTLLTHMSPDECVERLNDRSLRWANPPQWFSTQRMRPVQGKASRRGFSLTWRHAMTRRGGLPRASGRFEERAGATVVRMWLGKSVLDGMFVVVWLAIAILVGVPGAIAERADAPPGFGLFWLTGWVGIGALVFTLIGWLSRDDDVRLRRLIIEELEAEELGT